MKVLIVGNGGREHALAWALGKTADVVATPQNPGIAAMGKCESVGVDDFDGIVNLAKEEKADLVVVGPELPLVLGLSDRLKEEGIPVFGPSKAAAQLEGDKKFAKELMAKYNIPTAEYEAFTEIGPAEAYIDKNGAPIVIKATGLAAGKGAIVCQTVEDAKTAARSMLVDNKFGDAGKEIVIEECMAGEEASILAVTDGKTIRILPSSQDHKRVFDNDEGPNTGGMGAYSPALCVSDDLLKTVEETILRPTIDAMAKEGCAYSGVLYAGLMLTEAGPKVVEFNCRFGDPETQAVLPLVDGDLAQALLACARGDLASVDLKAGKGSAVCVVMASGGYPGSYEKGRAITGLDAGEEKLVVFHAGTRKDNDSIVTAGGRVLGVTALGDGLKDAIDRAYGGVGKIQFEGMQYRRDIGGKGLKYVQ